MIILVVISSFVRCSSSLYAAKSGKSISILLAGGDEEEMIENVVFCFESVECHGPLSFHHRIREWSISAARIAILVVVFDACVTHQRETFGGTRVTNEVGLVVKSSITRDTQSMYVFIEFILALFLCEFETGFVCILCLDRRHRSSRSKVDSSVGSSHQCSFFVSVAKTMIEKVFQFLFC